MDHHCVLMDNCVGKHSLRFFVQYSTWMALLLLWAIAVYIKGFYWQNRESGRGMQSLWEFRPDMVILQLLTMASPIPSQLTFLRIYGSVREDHSSFMTDNCLFAFSVSFFLFATSVLFQTLHNIRHCTSEPGKLKQAKPTGRVRSLRQMKKHIFGKQAGIWQMLLPFN